MTSETTPIRFSVSARDAARRWEEECATILTGDEPGVASVEQVEDLTWSWQIEDVESGYLVMRDAGPDRGEADVEVSRADESAPARIRSIVDRLADALRRPGMDPAVVAGDPHQGEASERSTDADQPL